MPPQIGVANRICSVYRKCSARVNLQNWLRPERRKRLRLSLEKRRTYSTLDLNCRCCLPFSESYEQRIDRKSRSNLPGRNFPTRFGWVSGGGSRPDSAPAAPAPTASTPTEAPKSSSSTPAASPSSTPERLLRAAVQVWCGLTPPATCITVTEPSTMAPPRLANTSPKPIQGFGSSSRSCQTVLEIVLPKSRIQRL